MSVARFCVCGFLMPANAAEKPCPACGRVSGPKLPATIVQPIAPTPDIPLGPLTFQAVEIGGTNTTPKADDDFRRERSKTFLAIQEEARHNEERRPRRANSWPSAGTFQDCIMYPLKSIVWVLVLAWSWAVLLIVGVRIVNLRGTELMIALAIVLPAAVIVLGFTHRLFQYAYASSSLGKSEMLSWPSFNLFAELKAGARGLIGLLAGPLPVAFLAGWFWLYSGRMQAIDALIIVELVTVALTWWLLAVIAAHEFGSIRPSAILRWFETHGWLPLLAIAGMMTIATFILWFTFSILMVDHSEGLFVQAIFLPAALVWVFALIFLLLRWLGVRVRTVEAEPTVMIASGSSQP